MYCKPFLKLNLNPIAFQYLPIRKTYISNSPFQHSKTQVLTPEATHSDLPVPRYKGFHGAETLTLSVEKHN